ncbi:MAG: hypothetical protein ING91_19510 [Rhodocyclaceae bacterium]|nr:hypothetical protein [Rhodocyclaceae bacterium]MCA3848771.1 hypothetical protein [Burkholderia sp.]
MDWKSLVATVAPMLGTALGGPLVGVAVKAIGDALGMPDADEHQIAEALSAPSSDALLALKQADQAFKVRMRELGISEEQLHAADRADARNMQAATRSWTPPILAGVVSVGFFGILIYLLAYGMPSNGGEALLILLGAMAAAWGQVMQFYFGSSAGSARKDDLLRGRQ